MNNEELARLAINRLKNAFPADNRQQEEGYQSLKKMLPVLAIRLAETGQVVTADSLDDYVMRGVEDVKRALESLKEPRKDPPLTYDSVLQDLRQRDPLALALARYYETGTIDNSFVTGDTESDREYRENLLYMACEKGDLPLLKYLHKHDKTLLAEHSNSLYFAGQNGHINVMKYLHEQGVTVTGNCVWMLAQDGYLETFKYAHDHCPEVEQQYPKSLAIASEFGYLDIVKYLHKNGADLTADNHKAFIEAAESGRLDVVQYCKDCGIDVTVEDNIAVIKAAANGHINVVRYLKENGANIYARNNEAFLMAAICGHQDVIDYLLSEGADISANNFEAFLTSAQFGRTDVVRRLAGHIYDEDIKNKAMIMAAEMGNLSVVKELLGDKNKIPGIDRKIPKIADNGNIHVIRFLQNNNIINIDNILNPDRCDDIRTQIHNMEQWKRLMGDDAPRGMRVDPTGIRPDTLRAVKAALEKENYYGNISNKYAYNLCKLFGTEDRVWTYMKTWGEYHGHVLHNITHQIDIPLNADTDFKAWGDAVLKFGPEMAKLVQFSDIFPVPPGSSLHETREKISKIAYQRSIENPELSTLCFSFPVKEKTFNDALDLWLEQKEKNFPAAQNIPEITIDGEDFNMPEAKFYRLAPDDIRGLFLGEIVDCCQSIGKTGAPCATHGFSSPDSGFYVVEKNNGEILGEVWAWRGIEGELVFDSLETLGQRVSPEQWQIILNTVGEKLDEHNDTEVTRLLVGVGGDTPKMHGLRETAACAYPIDYKDYRDSKSGQLEVWTATSLSPLMQTKAKTDLHIRPLHQEDISALVSLEHGAFDSSRYGPDSIMTEDDFMHFLGNNHGDTIFIAERNESLCGYIAIEFKPDDPDTPVHSANLYSMAVKPDKQAQSLGRYRIADALLNKAETLVKKTGYHEIHLETHAQNHTVINSLSRYHGYKEFDRYHGYYNDGGDAIRLRKTFSEATANDNAPASRDRPQHSNGQGRYRSGPTP